eukprot:gene6212-6686_t
MNNVAKDSKMRNNLIVAGVVYLGSVYGAYAYGQKNPDKNFLDVPPKKYPQKAYESADDAQKYLNDKANKK